MILYRKNDSGFSAIIIIIIAVITIGLIGTGWIMYDNLNKPSVVMPTLKPAPIAVVHVNEFKIPELNIKLVLPDELTDLIYYVDATIPSGGPVAFFTTTTLEQIDGSDSECTAKNGAIGAIWITLQDPKMSPGLSKLVEGSYVIYEHPQSGCSASFTASKLQTEQSRLLQDALPTATVDR